MKSTWDLLEHRCNYYTVGESERSTQVFLFARLTAARQFVIKEMLKRIGVDVESKNTGQNGQNL